MQSSSSTAHVDFSRFGAMREHAARDQHAALADVAEEFEALFVDLMLKSARDAEMSGGLFDSNALSTYREMLDHQLAITLARNNDLGIGAALTRQMDGLLTEPEKSEQTVDPAPERVAAAEAVLSALRRYEGPDPYTAPLTTLTPSIPHATSPARPANDYDPRRAFIARLAPHAAEAGASLGVAPRALLAQAALESGWGEHVIRRSDGRSSHNYFGIKAGGGWRGDVVTIPTTEYVNGRAVTTRAAFRAYDTPAEAFGDYVRFVGDNPRYRGALDAGADAARFARGLAKAGYATDPRYGEKIIAIIETGDWNAITPRVRGEN